MWSAVKARDARHSVGVPFSPKFKGNARVPGFVQPSGLAVTTIQQPVQRACVAAPDVELRMAATVSNTSGSGRRVDVRLSASRLAVLARLRLPAVSSGRVMK